MGRLVEEGGFKVKLPEVARWMSDTILTLIWCSRFQGRSDAFIGLGALNAFAGIVLKLLSLTRRSIFWAIDFSPRRFDRGTLDFIFHAVDDVASVRLDETWNVSERIIEEFTWDRIFTQALGDLSATFSPEKMYV
jgi:hypothetical protein